MTDEIKEGIYKGRAIPGSENFGVSDSGTEQCNFGIHIPELNKTLSTVLSFSTASLPFALERLRACGWKDGDTNLKGIGNNEINVQIRYDLWKGERKLKVEIQPDRTGGFEFKNKMAPAAVSRLFAVINEAAKKSPVGSPVAKLANGQTSLPQTSTASAVSADEFPEG